LKPVVPGRRQNRLLGVLFFVVMLACGVGLVLGMIARFSAGTAFNRYKNWEGLWVSYGEILVFAAVAWIVVVVGGLWAWIAQKREESSFIKKYKKDDDAT
jgi:hypothetical protein